VGVGILWLSAGDTGGPAGRADLGLDTLPAFAVVGLSASLTGAF
jgi:hypothetical protein